MAAHSRPRIDSGCRNCGAILEAIFADFGMMPLRTAPISTGEATAATPFAELRLHVCSDCRLVQIACAAAPADGAMRAQPARLPDIAALLARLGDGEPDSTTEAAAEDDAMLSAVSARGFAPLRLHVGGFGAAEAHRLRAADHAPILIVVDRLLTHVTEPRDVLEGLRALLAPGGVVVAEFPSLLRRVQDMRLDAFRHERFSLFSLTTAEIAFAQHGLIVFDAEETAEGGGMLRVFARHAEDRGKPITEAAERLREREAQAGFGGESPYCAFAPRLEEAKCAMLEALLAAHRAGQRIAGYGATPAADTWLRYCGLGPDLVPFIVDAAPQRHGMLLPATRIPIRPTAALSEYRPDIVLVPDGRDAIAASLKAIHAWGGRCLVPLPSLQVF